MELLLSHDERRVLVELTQGLELTLRPYLKIAERLNLSENEVIKIANDLLTKKALRRITAVVRDKALGYNGNVMVAWLFSDEAKLLRAGELAAARKEISHAYRRTTTERWKFNFYTMVHAHERDGAQKMVDELATEFDAEEYRMLYSLREFTKRRADYSSLLENI